MNVARLVRRDLIAAGALALVLSFCVDLTMLVVPIYDMQLYDRVLESRNMDTMAALSVACLVGLIFYGTFEYLRSLCFVAVGSVIGRQLLRVALREGVRRAAAGDRRTGPQLARDIGEIRSFLASGAVAVPLDALCTILFVAVLFILNPAFGYLALCGISGLVLFGIMAEHLVHPYQRAAQQARRDADYALARSLADADVVDGLGMLPAIARRWLERYQLVLDGLSKAAARTHWVSGVSRTYRLGLQAAVMFVGAILVVHGKATPGALMGANLLLNKTLNPFDHLVGSARTWLEARDAWGRIANLLEAVPSPGARTLPREVEPGLRAVGATISAGDERLLLTSVDFHLAPGTLALVAGPNGSGKTSLLRTLAGLMEPRDGYILLDGRPVVEAGGVGYLSQAVDLLEGDIGLNIGRMQRDLAGAIEAAREAGLHEAIGRMPRGYDTQLSSEAKSLSGGMRQRVGLARALYGSPRLLLLDEPDASLDTEGSAALARAVRAACDAGAVAVVISHRSTFREAADVLLQVEDGAVASMPMVRPTPQLESA